ncbi:MAG TPA: helix-turn-helix domain-containing protein [Bryobacteraceae bacterium]|nr:AraC family transcriptional regulator [Bryobacterales bacterium]HRJ18069.1 helix-turn-helix domain-containing protein [Bryobacteraceae bacterium]
MEEGTISSDVTEVLILAIPETAGSALYGLVDVLEASGTVWQTLVRAGGQRRRFRVRIVSPDGQLFTCGNRIPVNPDCAVSEDPVAPVVILPELWLGPDETLSGRYPEVIEWVRRRHAAGSAIYSVCSGAILLAETGLLDGCPATSHWAYEDLFRQRFPSVRFDPAPNLVWAGADGRIVTAGGTTSWHDLALHIIARHAGPAEALRIAKVYLLKWHDEGELPFAALVRPLPHGDGLVRKIEALLAERFQDQDALAQAVQAAGVPERTLKRRFKSATGIPLIDYLQNLRIEHGKHLLESTALSVEEISAEAGYSDVSFFRRLFKRLVGVTPLHYRRMFSSVAGEPGDFG